MSLASWMECSLALPARIFLATMPEVRTVDVCKLKKTFEAIKILQVDVIRFQSQPTQNINECNFSEQNYSRLNECTNCFCFAFQFKEKKIVK